MANLLLDVAPIYGWGWFNPDGSGVRDTPAAFTARVTGSEEEGWTGKVETPDHEFYGHVIRMTPRHAIFDGHVNVILDVATGYAVVS